MLIYCFCYTSLVKICDESILYCFKWFLFSVHDGTTSACCFCSTSSEKGLYVSAFLYFLLFINLWGSKMKWWVLCYKLQKDLWDWWSSHPIFKRLDWSGRKNLFMHNVTLLGKNVFLSKGTVLKNCNVFVIWVDFFCFFLIICDCPLYIVSRVSCMLQTM